VVAKERIISVHYLNKMKNFCVMPFMHGFVTHNGIGPCCAYTNNPKLNSSQQYWKSDQLKNIKSNMLNDVRDSGCKICWDKEDRGFASLRNHSNTIYNKYVDDIINGKTFDQPVVLDLRLGNLCNLKCRMCNSAWSSQIADEILSNPDLEWEHAPSEKLTAVSDETWELLDNWIGRVERVFMTGGEPTIIKKNLDYIQKIIQTGRSNDIELIFTTNATNVNREFLRLAENFKSVHFAVSIDAVEDLATYIRFPSDWNTIKQNLNTIGQNNFGVGINTTVQWLNMTRLTAMFNFIEEYIDSKPKQFAGVWFQLVTTPAYLDPIYAPRFMKEIAIEQISKFLENSKLFKDAKFNNILYGDLKHGLESTRTFLQNNIQLEKHKDVFLKKMEQLDRIRGQNLFDILPELKPLGGHNGK
jgi:sulfatase maturation enzyme AslB (radical SAM superfamily)